METNIEKGVITRIYLENFVTYNKVVIRPGRNLNVIIGPNGTGKSTIVCAIVLGLGGDVSVIGRARHLRDYIKNGCAEAKIEIELKESDSKKVVITRILTGNQSSWLLNGSPTSNKAIHNIITDFNIQVNNLCQFLPQDKVQDFSKMNAQELLENTEKSVGDPMLLEFHTKLKQYRSQHKSLEAQIATKKKLLQSQSQKYDGLKEIVGSIKERKMIKKKIVALKQKKAWIIYDQMRKKCKESKKSRDAAAVEMEKLKAQLQPIDEEILKLQSDIKSLKDSINDHNIKTSAITSEVSKIINVVSDYGHKIKDCEDACQRRIQAEQTRDEEIKIEQQHKSKLENDLAHMIEEVGSEETLLKQQQDTLCHMEKQRGHIAALTEKCVILRQKEERLNRAIKAEEDELRFANIETKRLELLKQRNMDAYKGVFWLRENRDRFSAPIHEPMLLHVNVTEAAYSKYIENCLPVRDLLAFVCENKQDMNLLLKCLRDQQRLQINAVHSDPLKKVYMQPNIPMDNIRKFGFKYYLVSLMDAPPTIMKYLVSMYNLNNIPVGSKAVEDNVPHIPHSLTCYFSESNIYSVSMSKYSAEKSTKISTVRGNGLLSIVLDTNKLQKIKEKVQHFNEEKNEIISNLKKMEEAISEGNKELEKYRTIKNKYQHDIQQIQALRSRIRVAEQKIAVLENERTSIEAINASTTSDIQTIIKNQVKAYKKYNSLLEDCFKLVTENEEIKLALKLQQRCLVTKENAIQELREEYATVEQEFKQLDEKLIPLKNEAKKLYNEALDITNGISPQDPAFKPIDAIFAKLPATVADIIKELNIAQAKAFCMGNNVDTENILREYEEVESDIQHLNEAIQRETSELTKKTQQMEKLREKWLTPLESLVKQINTNFSSHFAAMKCAGEVALNHGENIMDFDQYGLKIRVKFRDADELQELTRYRQSGGERAVTTAVYMIALQELSTVPFRCVDEINQGMDATNERRVFELLVKITGKPGSSQYFLLTPKLLPGLLYTDTVTMHCVFNGPFMIPHNEFETETYCAQITKSSRKQSTRRNA